MLSKVYDPGEIETKWFRHWEASGAFRCGQRPDAEPYVIVIPPPNVTGSLHVGHALNNSLQDILIRFERLRGKDVLWQPGMDHAGIATQMVVERQLDAEGRSRRDMGRDAFVERVWTWKALSGGTIEGQLKRLGASADWERSRFTMDEGLSRAVRRVFVRLYEQGLIYRDKRLVNWDPKLQTAISDLEVENKEVDGHFWHFRYPLADDPAQHLVVATTRPETMLGDTAVAVHPEDERYRHLIGQMIRLPLTDRLIPIVADSHADPEQGSGAVKITPAHDFNDFEVGKRHDLPQINVLDAHAHIDLDGSPYHGLDRYAARKAVVADMEAAGLLVQVEAKKVMMPYGDRSGVVIEPWLTDQWYVDAETLAQPAIRAVEEGRTRFVPENWTKTYYEWMRNIQPWCISRQLWWGHRIPAWYAPDGQVFVGHDEAEAYAKARAALGPDVVLTQDDDVLDTWFSSALWPFSTLGWPDETPELAKYYPTATLVTGFDIIFFWVARMMMMGLHFQDEVPFKTVYVTSLVRDAQGQKMSKSKGNVVDPLDYVERFGADALRFTMAAMESQGRDIKLAESRVEGYRNFSTKLWNASRFCQMNGIGGSDTVAPPPATLTVNRWIVSEMAATVAAVTEALDAFRFDAAASAIYHFTWHTFCDWYVEFIKPVLQGDEVDPALAAETRAVAGWALDQILVLLHPFMPFITEELWHALKDDRASDLIRAEWPTVGAQAIEAAARDEMAWVIKLIGEIRSARSEMNVPAGARVPAQIADLDATTTGWLERNREMVLRLARLDGVEPVASLPTQGVVQIVVGEATVALLLHDVLDFDAERARLAKARDKAEKEIRSLQGRLANENFIAKAKPEVVEDARAKLVDEQATVARIDAALARLA
ncbi:valine--tRNA ligase [Rhodothalassium salexigens]|uniref:valine--tRNA ligase n=1 Tax=Rhodothalassium salexigens TaxID=1086 RepID=UPI001911EF7B|nr:valine--tRNA ligase [Rhodothalassium salexigens]MBK5911268.1 valine--tRNA ligase [Rhodothalassium salexigens]